MPAQVLPIDSVVSDPEIRGGQPLIAGTTLRVSDLAAYHTLAGLTPDQLAAQFDLDLAQVHGALSYYYRHKAAIDAEIRANAAQADLWRQRLVEQGQLPEDDLELTDEDLQGAGLTAEEIASSPEIGAWAKKPD